MASLTAAINLDKDGVELQTEENNLNISLESDHLDPDQKAAHEADTLPMDGPQTVKTEQQNKWSAIAGRCRDHLSPILVKAGFYECYN